VIGESDVGSKASAHGKYSYPPFCRRIGLFAYVRAGHGSVSKNW
jgi:hypothetical protein